MLALRRTQKLYLLALLPPAHKNVGCVTYSSTANDDDGSSSDDEKKPKKQQKEHNQKSETAAQRLNRLLGSMQTANTMSAADFARPGEANRRRKEAFKQDAASKDVVTAAKNVASMLASGENDRKQTESELLAKLLGHTSADSAPAEGDENKTPAADAKDLNLSELIVGMKIDRRQQTQQPEPTRSEYVRRSIASRSKTGQSNHYANKPKNYIKREAEVFTGSVNLYGGEPLRIFKEPASLLDSPDILSTWSALSNKELSEHIAHPPANYYEKLIQWTDQGKIWRFPIDNEQDMHDEMNVDFSEHVFLEQHLEAWCPTKGPIRHFMELVCVGLSKNPYISAQDKKNHILWFRDYFEAKKDILKDLMSKDRMESVKSVSA